MLSVLNYTHTHTKTLNRPFSGATRASRYQKGKTNLDFAEATDSEWQWHQLGHMQVCTSLQTNNHVSTGPLSFLQVVLNYFAINVRVRVQDPRKVQLLYSTSPLIDLSEAMHLRQYVLDK